MINDLDESLKKLLITMVPLDPAEIDVSFDMPGKGWSASLTRPTVNLYLYNIQENRDLRNNEWSASRSGNMASRKKAPTRVDCSYLITAWTANVSDEHHLLGHLLAALFRFPMLPEEVLQGSLRGTDLPVRAVIAQSDGEAAASPAGLWSALDNVMKPSISCTLTIPVDLDITLTSPVVSTRIMGMSTDTGPEEFVQITGIVRPKGKPGEVVAGARLEVKELQMTATTDDEGRFIFRKLNTGSYTLEIEAPGRKKHSCRLDVPGVTYDVEI